MTFNNFGAMLIFFIVPFFFISSCISFKCTHNGEADKVCDDTDAACCQLTLGTDAGAEAKRECPTAGTVTNKETQCNGQCTKSGEGPWKCLCNTENCNKADADANGAGFCTEKKCKDAMDNAANKETETGTTGSPGDTNKISKGPDDSNNKTSTQGSTTGQPKSTNGTTPPQAKPDPSKKDPSETKPKGGDPNNKGKGAGFISNADLKKIIAAMFICAVIAA